MGDHKVQTPSNVNDYRMLRRILSVPVGLVLVLGIAAEYGEGHFLSWLTLPMIASFSLAVNRDIYRALLATFSMAFLHEGLWYFLGDLPFNVPLSNLGTTAHFCTFLLLPCIFTAAYLLWFRPHNAWSLLAFVGYMAVWDALGFPITTVPKPVEFAYLAPALEIGSWLTILGCYLFMEARA